MKHLIYIGIFVISYYSALAQIDAPTKEEIALETKFINALKPAILDDPTEARSSLEKFVEEHPLIAAGHYELAKIYKQLDEKQNAIDAFATAVRLNPENEWYRISYAQYLKDQSRFEEAASTYEGLIRDFPRHTNYYLSAAHAYLASDQGEKALELLDEAMGKVGHLEGIVSKKYLVLRSLGRDQAAEASLIDFLKSKPNSIPILIDLAEFYNEANNEAKELETYQRILDINPNHQQAKVRVSELSSDSGEELLQNYMSVIQDPNVDIDIKVEKLYPFILAVDVRQPNEVEQLLDAANKLVSVHPNDPKAFAIKADVLYNTAHTTKSLKFYEKVESLSPNVSTIWLQHLNVLNQLESYEKLAEVAEEALIYFPNLAEIYVHSAWANYKIGKIESAQEMLDASSFMLFDNEKMSQRHAFIQALIKKESPDQLKTLSQKVFIDPQVFHYALDAVPNLPENFVNQFTKQANGPSKRDYLAQWAMAAYQWQKNNTPSKNYIENCIDLDGLIDPRVVNLSVQLFENDSSIDPALKSLVSTLKTRMYE